MSAFEKCPHCGAWKKRSELVNHIGACTIYQRLEEKKMKIYELTFTGTEKLFKIKEVNCLPRDAEVVPFNFNKPIYYSEKTGQYYYCDK